jgi:hypothetical protein
VSRLWIISGSLLFVAASSLTQTSTPQRSGGCTDEDYAIFSAALEGEDGNHKLNSVILLDHTATGYPPGLAATTGVRRNEVQAFYNDVPKDAKDDFEARNKTRVELDTEKIKTPFQTLALSDKEAEKMLYRKWLGRISPEISGRGNPGHDIAPWNQSRTQSRVAL